MEKVAYFRVGEDANEWNRQVIQFFHEQFPYFMNTPIKIDWKRKEEAKGYAVGSIEIQEGEGMSVPIIIRYYNLYPFDIAFIRGNIMPLTGTTIQMYIQSRGAFLRAIPRDRADITTFLFNLGSPDYLPTEASVGHSKGASLLDKISSTITEDRKKEFFDYLDKNPDVFEGFKQNETVGPIMKIASAVYKEFNHADKLRNTIERDIHYIYKNGAYEYKAIFGNSRVEDPVELTLTEDQANRFEKIRTVPQPEAEKVAHIKFAAVYNVSNSDRQVGILEDQRYFEIPPERKKLAEVENKVISDDPKISDNGIFKTAEFTSKPFRVTSIWTDERNRTYIETFDGLSKTAYCRFQGIRSPYTEKNVTYLPSDARFIKLGERIEIPLNYNLSKATNWITKTAEDRYAVSGTVLGSREDLNIHEVNWTLIQNGAGQDLLEKVASLRVGQRYPIEQPLRKPVPFTKVAQLISEEKEKRSQLLTEISRNLTKEAAQLGDVPTVDVVLSLQFATKNNVEEFVNYLPMFEDIIHYLARMLLITRLGNELVREDVLKRTMMNLVDIIEVLQGLKTIVEKGKK